MVSLFVSMIGGTKYVRAPPDDSSSPLRSLEVNKRCSSDTNTSSGSIGGGGGIENTARGLDVDADMVYAEF